MPRMTRSMTKASPISATLDNQKDASETVGEDVKMWKKDDRVLCRYLDLNLADIYYEAKIQLVENNDSGPVYSIHYQVMFFMLLEWRMECIWSKNIYDPIVNSNGIISDELNDDNLIINDDLNLKGWNSRHDEKIPHADALVRFKDHTVESAAKAKVKKQSLYFIVNSEAYEITPTSDFTSVLR